MTQVHRWVLVGGLFLAGVLILTVWIPSRRPDAMRIGTPAEANVLSKDSRPMSDGGMVYTVRFIFQDAQRRNHDAACEVDSGTWSRLKPGQKVRATYLPNDTSQAYIDGAVPPPGKRSGALTFVAYSAIVAAIVLGGLTARAALEAPALASGGTDRR